MSSGVDRIVNDIVDQMNLAPVREEKPKDIEEVTEENLEKFVIDSASQLVRDSLDLISEFSGDVRASGEPGSVEAAAALIKSSSAAIESLNKLLISNKRNKSQQDLKKMDIDAKIKMNTEDNQTKLVMSREDVFKYIMSQEDVDDPIESDIVDI